MKATVPLEPLGPKDRLRHRQSQIRNRQGRLIMEVRLHATLRQLAGVASVLLDLRANWTVGDALRALVDLHPRLEPAIWHADGTLAGHVAVVLDGRDVRHLNGVETPLGDAGRLDVFPPVGGGRE